MNTCRVFGCRKNAYYCLLLSENIKKVRDCCVVDSNLQVHPYDKINCFNKQILYFLK
ncbi:hypothetical protein Hanom_Chr08g00741101 [Helianthus anomalus]